MPSLSWALVVPVAGAALIAVLGDRAARATRWLALAGPVVAAWTGLRALQAFADGLTTAGGGRPIGPVSWLGGGAGVAEVGFSLDMLAAVMLAVVGTVAAMIVLFSIGYMAKDTAQARYFALLSLFTAAMAGLVTSSTLVALFIAWELVGACSYLLIGFWFTRPKAAAAAVKAFLVTRAGDLGLLLAVLVIARQAGTLRLAGLATSVASLPSATVLTVALLLFVGAAGKSAQFPFHVWLPDAMEGPTPVSALIHAATMVAAGVFLIARTWPVFAVAEAARAVVLAVGTLTALGAALVACTQTDIKKVLAYSTISQLGFMFAALGAGAWVAAVFHLVTHAAFKALLFLCAGSVIHGAGTQDLREMGGLARRMPVTAITWVIGAAALAGIPPLAGFFSKDAVLDAVFGHAPVAGAVLVAASALTAFYAARTTRLAFAGPFRGTGHPHEASPVMTLPLVGLAFGAAFLGASSTSFAETFGGHAGVSVPIAVTTTVVALASGGTAWRLYAGGPVTDERVARRVGRLWAAAERAFGVDDGVMRTARWLRSACAALYERFDRGVIDRMVLGCAGLARWLGVQVTSMQTGEGSLYAAFVGVGAVLLVSLALWLAR